MRTIISYFTLKEIRNTELAGWKCYRDCYGMVWAKTSRWSLFRTPILSEKECDIDYI